VFPFLAGLIGYLVRIGIVLGPKAVTLQYVTAEWEPAFLRQARDVFTFLREFLFFLLLPWEASKRAPIFDTGTGSTPERLRSGSLQADLSLII
jgi:hypothetical protein